MPHDTSDNEITNSSVDTRIHTGLFLAQAASTARAYWREWRDFAEWCRRHGYSPLPATSSTVAEYLSTLSQSLALSSLHRKLAAISCAHALCGEVSPTHAPSVCASVALVRRQSDGERFRKAGLTADDIGRIAAAL